MTALDSIPFPEFGRGYYPPPCPEQRCGQPQDGPGHPRKGWVQTKVAGEAKALWHCGFHCGFHCASRYLIRRELGGFQWTANLDATVDQVPQHQQRTRNARHQEGAA